MLADRVVEEVVVVEEEEEGDEGDDGKGFGMRRGSRSVSRK